MILIRAENPHTWIVHLDDRIDDSLGRAKLQGFHGLRRGDPISIQRDDLELDVPQNRCGGA